MTDLVGKSTIEIVGASFMADEDAIFGTVNWDYVEREEAWYDSMSRNVHDIPGGAPAIWKAVADPGGLINSNYGWCIYSPENGFQDLEFDVRASSSGATSQYNAVLNELSANPESRRATMIYTRPSMWRDYNRNGRSDFMCTTDVQYLVRNGAVDAVVRMRSNDAIMGFKNDRAWQDHVLEKLTNDLSAATGATYRKGTLHWQVGSLHVYARHYYLIDPVNYTK